MRSKKRRNRRVSVARKLPSSAGATQSRGPACPTIDVLQRAGWRVTHYTDGTEPGGPGDRQTILARDRLGVAVMHDQGDALTLFMMGSKLPDEAITSLLSDLSGEQVAWSVERRPSGMAVLRRTAVSKAVQS